MLARKLRGWDGRDQKAFEPDETKLRSTSFSVWRGMQCAVEHVTLSARATCAKRHLPALTPFSRMSDLMNAGLRAC